MRAPGQRHNQPARMAIMPQSHRKKAVIARSVATKQSPRLCAPGVRLLRCARNDSLKEQDRREETMSDTQRAAIVTGAAGGIGRALVKGLLGAGIRVAAVD